MWPFCIIKSNIWRNKFAKSKILTTNPDQTEIAFEVQKGQIKLVITQKDKHWTPFIFEFLKYVLSTDFNDILLKKVLIQEHWGVGYLNI